MWGEKGNVYRILVGKLERKGSLLSPRSRWKDNIKQNCTGTAYEDEDWIDVAQDID